MNEQASSGDKPSAQGVDADLDREIQEALGDQSIDQLMEASLAEEAAQAGDAAPDAEGVAANEEQSGNRLGGEKQSGEKQGGGKPRRISHDMRRGRISAVRGEDVFVDLVGETGKLQGVVPLTQFDRAPRVGAIMDFVVDKIDETQGLIFLSREGAVKRATWEQLTPGSAVEARCIATNKGGLDLEMVGGIRAFMPASQIDTQHVDDLDQFIGQKLEAMVQEIDRKSKRVVLSRRELLRQRQEAAKTKLFAQLSVGDVVEGKVRSIVDFGAFVDLGGVDGLIHVSDLSYSHVDKPRDVVKVGQDVKVKVLKLEMDKERIGLGLKQVAPDPWESVANTMTPGESVSGRVVRLANFGAFVEVAEGVEGLLPISELAWKRIGHPKEVISEGQVIHLKLLSLDADKRRMTLSLKQATGDPWVGAEGKYPRHSVQKGKVLSTTTFGAFIELETGVEGLVHISELSDRRVGKVEDVLNIGDEQEFRVLEIDEEERKIKLSLKGAKEPAPQPEAAPDYKPQPAKRPKPKNLKPGIGKGDNDYGMGMGLGDLKL